VSTTEFIFNSRHCEVKDVLNNKKENESN
jgi:hypothetical protein